MKQAPHSEAFLHKPYCRYGSRTWDIHFDYKLAIGAAEAGAAKIRINPGNIGGEDRVEAVVKVCKERNIPIRIHSANPVARQRMQAIIQRNGWKEIY